MNALARIAAGLSVVAVCGCAAATWYGNPAQPKTITISIGMTQDEAKKLLGPPASMLAQQLPGVLVETWKYVDRTLIFHNGILQSVVTY
ncbi:MAG: hypothetical protein HYY15_01160 [Candidatus Omnitrophica bacterium]|nr:hypothetical protein [Candidatus Omnitrophota bacterium]